LNLEVLVEFGTIDEADLGLFDIVDDAEEGWEACVRRGLDAHIPLNEEYLFIGPQRE
jgi:hypothetical protein